MGNSRAQNDTQDLTGQTIHKNGPFGTVATKIPASPITDQFISEILINTQEMVTASQRLLVSFDAGVTYMQFKKNTIVGWFVRGKVTQLYVKGSVASVPGEIVVNMEDL